MNLGGCTPVTHSPIALGKNPFVNFGKSSHIMQCTNAQQRALQSDSTMDSALLAMCVATQEVKNHATHYCPNAWLVYLHQCCKPILTCCCLATTLKTNILGPGKRSFQNCLHIFVASVRRSQSTPTI